MPLVRPQNQAASPEQPITDPRADLAHANPARRRQAARFLAGDAAACAALAARLPDEPDPLVRDAIGNALVAIGDEAAASAFARLLPLDDAGLRVCGLDGLRMMGAVAAPLMPALLADPDPDVRIMAVEMARGLATPEAEAHLASLLRADPHPNVCLSALDVLAEIGTPTSLADIAAVRARFADNPMLGFAADIAATRAGGGPTA
jgi:HEAT repeat protein